MDRGHERDLKPALRALTVAPTRTLLILTFVSGVIDAVTFLGLAQVFAAMQTGNVIFLGLGISGAADAPIAAPAIGLGAFLLGSAIAAVTFRGAGQGRGLIPALGTEVLLLAGAACLAAVSDVSSGTSVAYVLVAVLALTMGLRNTFAREVGGSNLATTVLNLTLIASATMTGRGAASGAELAERAAALGLILAGAVCGGLLIEASNLAVPLALAAAVTLSAALLHARDAPSQDAGADVVA